LPPAVSPSGLRDRGQCTLIVLSYPIFGQQLA
jgi:hypothetical protein